MPRDDDDRRRRRSYSPPQSEQRGRGTQAPSWSMPPWATNRERGRSNIARGLGMRSPDDPYTRAIVMRDQGMGVLPQSEQQGRGNNMRYGGWGMPPWATPQEQGSYYLTRGLGMPSSRMRGDPYARIDPAMLRAMMQMLAGGVSGAFGLSGGGGQQPR